MLIDPRELTQALGGKWHQSSGRAPCPVCHGNPKNPPLAIAKARRGGVVLHCWKGCSFGEVMDGLRGLGLAEGQGSYSPPSAETLAAKRKAAERDAQKRAYQAQMCWDEAQSIADTLAEDYLLGRRITCALPDSLRFHPDCWHGPTARRLPAMIARIDGTPHFAIHRTYLTNQGDKAKADPNKMALGSIAGGAVRLTEDGARLVVTEGIETALSLASGALDGPATLWAALGTSGMAGLILPPSPHNLTIATDGDTPGRDAGHKLAERAQSLGWTVSILAAPDGQDWNDVLRGVE